MTYRVGFRHARRQATVGLLSGLALVSSSAQPHDPAPSHHPHHPPASAAAGPADPRTLVNFPPALRHQTLAHMREHLQALQEIQQALATQAYDRAADIAETRLGVTSLPAHGAADVAPYMPPAMQAAGTTMHRAASRLARAAQDAGATGDPGPALAASAELIGACVACHAGFRLQ